MRNIRNVCLWQDGRKDHAEDVSGHKEKLKSQDEHDIFFTMTSSKKILKDGREIKIKHCYKSLELQNTAAIKSAAFSHIYIY